MREKYLNNINTIVIKIGSGIIDEQLVNYIADWISEKQGEGRIKRFVIVSSGAIRFGLKEMGMENPPTDVSTKQAIASIGQVSLINFYKQIFSQKGLKVAQILVSHFNFFNRKAFTNLRNTFKKLFEFGVIPIVNENDAVATEEIKFGDNDTLSALVSILVNSNLTIILTNVDGLYKNYGEPDQERISIVKNVNMELFELVKKEKGKYSVGGMYTKLVCAKVLTEAGIPLVIADSKIPNVLEKIINGEDIGTFFIPKRVELSEKEKWLAFVTKEKGKIYVDQGVIKAIQSGKSLLPVGIKKVEGNFSRGDIVGIYTEDNKLLALGITNYSSAEIDLIKSQKTSDIKKLYPHIFHKEEVVHRDNMVTI